MRRVTISIDYDDTYSADPNLWWGFILAAKNRGHRVIVVTNRDRTQQREVLTALADVPVDDVIFAGPSPKRRAAVASGWYPDIWIDDRPDTVERAPGPPWSRLWRNPRDY
jgi:FMN phosphatase YigB (HAD superfamily)